ncbi:hypothetical protein [Vineibacter terrae]|uniref:hypothetical protein n=1 Tax=Vineibacter terrae TaxID=2586908 RepID=UPI002E2FCE6B|nr:hypothetical protein [Vineibacter terrae]HEX2889961.1 hypothetical protein [Vineibacter terrae]
MDERIEKTLIDVADLVKTGQQAAVAQESAWAGLEQLAIALGVLATHCAALEKRLQAVESKLAH